jgi:subfamily B ATP-binding cassette protein HlyB/CyaB
VGEVGAVSGFLSSTIMTVALDLLFAIIYLAILFALSSTLALVILALLPIQALLFLAFGPFLRGRLHDQFLAGSAQSAWLVETLGGAVAIKALAAEDPVRDRMMAALHGTLHQTMRVGTIQNWSGALEGVFSRVVTIAILVIGSRLIFAGELTLGQLIAFHLLADRVAGPILSIAGLWEAWQQLTVSRTRLGEVWSEAPEPEGRPVLLRGFSGSLAFEDVTFGYDPGKPVAEGVDFTAHPGRPFLIVGPSGVGKSTIGKLAAGLYEPQTGRVTLGGRDLAGHDPISVRRAVAYVPQEPLLFLGTVRENLVFGAPDADGGDIEQALRLAVAEDVVAQLPEGLDASVGERGGLLSGGQRQRLAIARALLAGPDALVLDEPTSALDPETQERVVANLEVLACERSVIVITHRPELFDGAPRLALNGAEPIQEAAQ